MRQRNPADFGIAARGQKKNGYKVFYTGKSMERGQLFRGGVACPCKKAKGGNFYAIYGNWFF